MARAENITNCPLCEGPVPGAEVYNGSADIFSINCPRCGIYRATDEFLDYTDQRFLRENGYILSGISRELQETGASNAFFTTQSATEYLSDPMVPILSRVKEKAQKLLDILQAKTSYFGEYLDLFYANDYPLAYAKNKNELKALVSLLSEGGFIKQITNTSAFCRLTVTADGLEIVADTRNIEETDRVFIAIWFDDSMNGSIAAIKSAVSESGYRPICIRNEYYEDTIMDKALSEIRKSTFLVVDLTGNRRSIYFEAGFAFGLNKQIIYVYKKDDTNQQPSLDFYVKHYQCHEYDTEDNLKQIIKDAIGARITKDT